MKKLSLIVVSLLVTLFSYSQDFGKIVRASKCEFINNKWVSVETQYPTEMFIIMKDWEITIGTYKLRTYGDYEVNKYEDHICYTWKAVNSEGKKCFFLMKKFRQEITTHMLYAVLYPEYEIMYEYESEN